VVLRRGTVGILAPIGVFEWLCCFEAWILCVCQRDLDG